MCHQQHQQHQQSTSPSPSPPTVTYHDHPTNDHGRYGHVHHVHHVQHLQPRPTRPTRPTRPRPPTDTTGRPRPVEGRVGVTTSTRTAGRTRYVRHFLILITFFSYIFYLPTRPAPGRTAQTTWQHPTSRRHRLTRQRVERHRAGPDGHESRAAAGRKRYARLFSFLFFYFTNVFTTPCVHPPF